MTFPPPADWDRARAVIRERFAIEFAGLDALHAIVDDALGTGPVKPQYTPVESAVIGHLGRATQVALDVRFLCELARVQGAFALTRSLAECLVSLAYLLVDADQQDARARQFEDFEVAELKADRKLSSQVGWDKHAGALDQAIRQDARSGRPRTDFPQPERGWTKLRGDELDAEIASFWSPEKWEDVRIGLRIARNWGNSHIHIGAGRTLDHLYQDDDGNRTFATGGDPDGVPAALALATGLYAEILRAAGTALGIPALTRVEVPNRHRQPD